MTIPLAKYWEPQKPIDGDFYFRENLVLDQENGKHVDKRKYDREKHELEFEVNIERFDFRLIQIER